MNAEKEKAIVHYVEAKVDKRLEEKTNVFLTKDDKLEIISMIKDSRNEMIKWMFIFWIGTVGVLSGVMFAMLHAYLK